MGKLKCPKCRSTNVQLIASGLNTKQKTSLNLNPLSLTVFNHKQKAKRGLLTGRKKTREFQCIECGKTWMEK